MSTIWCRRATTATALALFALALICSYSHAAVVSYVDPSEIVEVNDRNPDTSPGPSIYTINSSYRIGDTGGSGTRDSSIWVKFLLPPSEPGQSVIQSAKLIVGGFSASNQGTTIPGVGATPSTNDAWAAVSSNITNTDSGLVASEFKNLASAGVNNNFSGAGGPQLEIDVTSWFTNLLGEGLGQHLSVKLSGGDGHVPFQVNGSRLTMNAPVTYPNNPAVRLELTLVPEPATAGLLLFSAATVAVVRRRFRKVRG